MYKKCQRRHFLHMQIYVCVNTRSQDSSLGIESTESRGRLNNLLKGDFYHTIYRGFEKCTFG